MPGGGLIDKYLHELDARLRLPARRRERVLAEVADHLRSAAAPGDEAAERAAIGAFGSPELVGRRFAEELALAESLRATWLVSAATLAFCGLVAFSLGPLLGNAGALPGVVAQFAAQIAFTCATLSTLRALRHRGARALPVGKLRLMLRGDALAAGAILLTSLTALAGALRGRGADDQTIIVGAALTAGAALLVIAALVRAVARERALTEIADEPVLPGDDALADVLALSRELRDRAAGDRLLHRPAAALECVARTAPVRACAARLHLREHPWRAALALGVFAGAAFGLAHGISEGPSRLSQIPRGLAAFAAICAIETAAVLICFAALGRFLGISRMAGGQEPLSARRR